jgi:hypothetical protein
MTPDDQLQQFAAALPSLELDADATEALVLMLPRMAMRLRNVLLLAAIDAELANAGRG